MNPASPPLPFRDRAVRLWLGLVAALIFVMVLVGGATRLTESGLSIVEWKPVTGVLPPLTEADWRAEFAKYQAIPQYRMVNRGMSPDDFKTIYWWEWVHRLLGRVIGVVFLLPFLFFLWRGWIEPHLRPRLWVIFGLGALQGAVGWWMVASGLSERVDVSQYRLATHLLLACLIYVAVLWTAAGLKRKGEQTPLRLRAGAVVLLGLVLLQIYLGALVAGLDAGMTYNTWPTIEGQFIPPVDELFPTAPWWRHLFENWLTVQFDHRMVGYVVWFGALVHAVAVLRGPRRSDAMWALALAAAVTIQAAFGIFTLLYQVPIALALAHQAMAIVVLTVAVLHAERLTSRGSVAA